MTIVPLDETMMRLWVGLRAQLAPQTPLSQQWLEGCALLDAEPFMAFLALGQQGGAGIYRAGIASGYAASSGTGPVAFRLPVCPAGAAFTGGRDRAGSGGLRLGAATWL